MLINQLVSLREKCQYSELFWSIFSRIHTPYLSVFSPNAGKYRPEKLRIRILFTKCFLFAYASDLTRKNQSIKIIGIYFSSVDQKFEYDIVSAKAPYLSQILPDSKRRV